MSLVTETCSGLVVLQWTIHAFLGLVSTEQRARLLLVSTLACAPRASQEPTAKSVSWSLRRLIRHSFCPDGAWSWWCVRQDKWRNITVVDTDECASAPCLNGGFCIDGINGYTCNCPVTFTGLRCETRECNITSSWYQNPCSIKIRTSITARGLSVSLEVKRWLLL